MGSFDAKNPEPGMQIKGKLGTYQLIKDIGREEKRYAVLRQYGCTAMFEINKDCGIMQCNQPINK